MHMVFKNSFFILFACALFHLYIHSSQKVAVYREKLQNFATIETLLDRPQNKSIKEAYDAYTALGNATLSRSLSQFLAQEKLWNRSADGLDSWHKTQRQNLARAQIDESLKFFNLPLTATSQDIYQAFMKYQAACGFKSLIIENIHILINASKLDPEHVKLIQQCNLLEAKELETFVSPIIKKEDFSLKEDFILALNAAIKQRNEKTIEELLGQISYVKNNMSAIAALKLSFLKDDALSKKNQPVKDYQELIDRISLLLMNGDQDIIQDIIRDGERQRRQNCIRDHPALAAAAWSWDEDQVDEIFGQQYPEQENQEQKKLVCKKQANENEVCNQYLTLKQACKSNNLTNVKSILASDHKISKEQLSDLLAEIGSEEIIFELSNALFKKEAS